MYDFVRVPVVERGDSPDAMVFINKGMIESIKKADDKTLVIKSFSGTMYKVRLTLEQFQKAMYGREDEDDQDDFPG